MKKFTNKNIKKENKFMIRRLIIFVLVIILALSLKVWEYKMIEKDNKEIQHLNSIIMSDSEREDKKAYLDIKSIPYEFAVSDTIAESYYMVSDGEFLYIAYMSPTDFEKLNKEDIKENPIRIEGITQTTTEEIKQLAVETYNEEREEEKKITLDEFDSYFGDVYLNMSIDKTSNSMIPEYIFIMVFLFGAAGTIISIYQLVKFRRSISKMDEMLLEELDNEMNDENAFYYEKAHIYLTNKYIINFDGRFIVINYKDVVWMYAYEQRTNGIKTSQAIKVMTNEGKTYTIANIELITKSKKEIYNEIWNTIVSKNENIVLGYTKENIKEMNERFKKNKTQNL